MRKGGCCRPRLLESSSLESTASVFLESGSFLEPPLELAYYSHLALEGGGDTKAYAESARPHQQARDV